MKKRSSKGATFKGRKVKSVRKAGAKKGRGNAVRHCPICKKAGFNGRTHPEHKKRGT